MSDELTLDPSDWEPLRALGYRMVDDVIRLHASLHDEPAWQQPNPDARALFEGGAPRGPRAAEDVYDDVARHILPYHYGNIHARGWGWVNGVGTTVGAFADMIAAAMSPNTWGGDHSATHIESQVLRWFAEALGFPANAAGLLTSGGSVANLVALAAARERCGGVYENGVAQRALTFYASAEVHNSVDKAVATLGIGVGNLRRIPCDADYRMRTDALRETIRRDVAEGKTPVAVVATAGTVNTGAFDDIDEIADICSQANAWLHVDGAFGAMVALSPAHAHLLRGLERADSVAFDFHKWLHVPVDCGCIITRTGIEQRQAFSPPAHYLARLERGVTAGDIDFAARGLQLTRSFRALKVWMTMQTYGLDMMGALVAQNIEQAAWLASAVEQSESLELLAPVPLNIVCFRYTRTGVSGDQLNAMNREILMQLQESGTAVVSSTVLQGRFALRACICNHRTRQEDLEALVQAVLRLGNLL